MTESLLQRLHDALQPRYSVRDELGEGGMAIVYLGYDHSLEREVAVKVLRPELATATLSERFLREARTCAAIRHPNVVPIHDFGEVDGLIYFVMDRVSGETLQARIDRGPLSHDEAVAVAVDILEALEAAHALGVVHRDIKPANIFLTGGRAVLGDFGIAKQIDQTAGLTQPDQAIGTPRYMAPEQLTGVATEATDIHAVGMVLYESLTGRPWRISDASDTADWKAIPGRTSNALRVALRANPEQRWPTVTAFRSQLRGGRRFNPLVAGVTAVAVVAALAVVATLTGVREAPGAAPTDLALLPCVSLPGSADMAEKLGFVAVGMLRDISDTRFTPYQTSAGTSESLNTDRVATCRVFRSGADSLRITLSVLDREGVAHQLAPIIAPADDPPLAAAGMLALKLLETVDPGIPIPDIGFTKLVDHDLEAVSAFLSGAMAFRRNAWDEATGHFADAVTIDSTFTLAAWRLADGQRWSISSGTLIDLDRLFREHAVDLGAVDRRMLEATVARRGEEQFELYKKLIEDYPNDPYATLSYGDELFHRGALFGVDLDSALAVLQLAAEQDSFLAPAYHHLAWLSIRLGDAQRAAAALDRFGSIAASPEMTALLRLAYIERFEPEGAPEARDAMFGPRRAGDLQKLSLAARFAASFGVPETQLEIGSRQVAATGSFSTVREGPLAVARTSGHLAQGLGLVAMGRLPEAIAHFDSSAESTGTPEGRLVAAQWRAVPHAVGLVGVPDPEREVGLAALREIARDSAIEPRLRARAAWSLSISEAEDGDTDAARRWLDALRVLPRANGDSALQLLGEAVLAAEMGDIPRALDISAPLAEYDSAAIVERPFQRAVSHLKRGEWFALSGSPERADSAWTWYDNLDLEGLPIGGLQAAEVDWALGVHGRMLRARLNESGGDGARACALATEVIRYWSAAGPEFEALVEEARVMCAA